MSLEGKELKCTIRSTAARSRYAPGDCPTCLHHGHCNTEDQANREKSQKITKKIRTGRDE